MDKVKWGLAGLLIGVIIGFFLIPKVPDVQYKHDKIFWKEKSSGTTTITIDTHSTITGGTTATVTSSGNTVVSGTNLSIETSTHTTATTITNKETEYKEIYKEKIINYSAAIYVLWNPLDIKIYPSVIGASYMLINPLSLAVYYDIDDRKIRAGIAINF